MTGMLVALVLAAQPAAPLFVTSDRCVSCHNMLTAEDGADVSIGSAWRGSMMAHSALDPYWQASVSRETAEHPAAAAAIEHECAACHMPMARYEAKLADRRAQVLDLLPLTRVASPQALLAADGVSCAMCHQITPDGFGQPESFSGGFEVDRSRPLGDRPAFGPYAVDAGRARLMRSAALLEPTESAHVQQAELCASCHTLFTHTLDAGGNVTGEFPEQVPYLEWRHGGFFDVRSCQSCHMPELDVAAPISSVAGQPREAFSQHVFRGGNFFVPMIMNEQRDVLGVSALPQELHAAARRTTEHLQQEAATVTIDSLERGEDRLVAIVRVDNLAGHKLPTAYPSRRAWLHVVVRDRSGNTVFESGRLEPDGSIAGNDNDRDGSTFEPHRNEITSPEQVQIYEPILVNDAGAVTTVLLHAARYAKDNRLLPDGFDKATAGQAIAVHGAAAKDADFVGGSDRVRYVVPLAGASAPFTVTAQLLYQPIGFRWAHNLDGVGAEETDRFVKAYAGAARRSAVRLAHARSIAE